MHLLLADQGETAHALVPHRSLPPALRRRTDVVSQTAAPRGLQVPYLGTTPLFSGHRVYHSPDCDWVLMPLAEDPLFEDRDGYPLPEHILRHLETVRAAGVEFDTLYVAHETEKGKIRAGRPLDVQALMPPPPESVVRLSNNLGNVAEAGWKVAASVVRASAAIAVAGAAALPLAAAVDPVLFGAVVAPGRPVEPGELASWFVLAAWIYGGEDRR